MLHVLLIFVAGALLFYVLLGGADYGAGMLELFAPRPFRLAQRRLVNHAMGPVWEANHMWLIILVVVFFMGFPGALAQLMVSLHLPVVALLLGIVVRGAVFTFRHYDPEGAARSQSIFTALFAGASLWSSVWLGILAASVYRGRIDEEATDFWTAYMAPWWGLYPLCVGLMVALSFAFLASVYLVSETHDPHLQNYFLRRAHRLNAALVTSEGLVAMSALMEHNGFAELLATSPWAHLSLATATLLALSLWLGWFGPNLRHPWIIRGVGAAQISCLLLGWFFLYAPNVYVGAHGPVTFFDVAAPPQTQRQLVLALGVGSVLVFPCLFYLFLVFKRGHKLAPPQPAQVPEKPSFGA